MQKAVWDQHLSLPLYRDDEGVLRVGDSNDGSLDAIVAAFIQGDTPEEIADSNLMDLSEVYLGIAYYLQNTDEVHQYLRRRFEEAQEEQHRQVLGELRTKLSGGLVEEAKGFRAQGLSAGGTSQAKSGVLERVILCNMLRDPRLVPAVKAQLSPNDFQDERHRSIYRAIEEPDGAEGGQDTGAAVDRLVQKLDSLGELSSIGGKDFVARLAESYALEPAYVGFCIAAMTRSRIRGLYVSGARTRSRRRAGETSKGRLERDFLALLVFVDKEQRQQALDMLRSEHFEDERNRLIFCAAAELHKGVGTVDVHTVYDKLREEGSLDRAGGLGYLFELDSRRPNPARFSNFVVELCFRTAVVGQES